MDRAISYNKTLLKINRVIDMLQTCGLDVTEFENARDSIDEEAKNQVKGSYDYKNPEVFAGRGQEAFLIQGYTSAESKLNKLYTILEQYELYIKAYSLTKLIKEFLSKNDKDPDKLREYEKELTHMINELESSSTLDYQIEGPIIKDIYHVVYLFIKEEIIVLGESKILLYLKDNEYLNYEVRRELENLNLKDSRYKEVLIKKSEIDARGFNSLYTDSDLIKLIALSEITNEKKEEVLESLENKLTAYLEELKKLHNNITNLKERKYRRFNKKTFAKNTFNTSIELGIALGIFFGFRAVDNALSPHNVYLNNTRTYSSLTDEPTITSEYDSNDSNRTTMYEYYPSIGWISYDLGNLDDQDISKYMNIDIDSIGVKGEVLQEQDIPIDLQEVYNETVRIIKQINVDIDDVSIERNLACDIMFVGFRFMCEMIFLTACLELKGNAPIIPGIIELCKNLRILLEENQDKKKNKQNITKLTKELVDLVNNNEDTIKGIGEFIPLLENNPEFSERISEMKSQLETCNKIVKKRELTK